MSKGRISSFQAPFEDSLDCSTGADIVRCCRQKVLPPNDINRTYAYYSIPDYCCSSLKNRPNCPRTNQKFISNSYLNFDYPVSSPHLDKK